MFCSCLTPSRLLKVRINLSPNFASLRLSIFHFSALRQEYSPNTERSYFPSLCEPKSTVERGPPLWCAEWEVGVGAMRRRGREPESTAVFVAGIRGNEVPFDYGHLGLSDVTLPLMWLAPIFFSFLGSTTLHLGGSVNNPVIKSLGKTRQTVNSSLDSLKRVGLCQCRVQEWVRAAQGTGTNHPVIKLLDDKQSRVSSFDCMSARVTGFVPFCTSPFQITNVNVNYIALNEGANDVEFKGWRKRLKMHMKNRTQSKAISSDRSSISPRERSSE
ncbi:hypothetical protein BD769DRAFT_1387995 [Suillus cothurnatus]|nr:hypothetical protein BD769DRAFT_1387995 [Suillus cothurnatus]